MLTNFDKKEPRPELKLIYVIIASNNNNSIYDWLRLCILCVFCTYYLIYISNNLVSLIYVFLIKNLAGDAAVKTEGENAPENAQQEVTASA